MANEINVWAGTTNAYATAGNWTLHVPLITENVIIPKDSTQAIAGSDQDAVALSSFTEEYGYSSTIGSRAVPLLLQATAATLAGTGAKYIGGTLTTLTLANGQNTNIIDETVVTTLNVISGTPNYRGANLTTATVLGGTLTYGESGKATTTVATLNIRDSARCVYNSSGTVTACNLDGILDLSGDARAVTITTLTVGPDAQIIDPNKRLTITNAVVLAQGVKGWQWN